MVKLYEEFNADRDYELIISELIPFVIKKYNDLSRWVENKFGDKSEKLKKIIVEYYDKPQYWDVIIVVDSWRYNKANRIIENPLSSEVVKKAKNIGVDLKFVTNAAAHAPMNTHYIIYNIENKTIEKK
jgi:hypothetical protein